MVLTDPGFLVAQAVQVLQQFKIAVKGFRWILVERMKGRQEDAVAHRNCAGHWSDASFRLPILGSGRISHNQSHQLPSQGWIIALPLQGYWADSWSGRLRVKRTIASYQPLFGRFSIFEHTTGRPVRRQPHAPEDAGR